MKEDVNGATQDQTGKGKGPQRAEESESQEQEGTQEGPEEEGQVVLPPLPGAPKSVGVASPPPFSELSPSNLSMLPYRLFRALKFPQP